MSSTGVVSFTNRPLYSFCSMENSELGVAHGSCSSLVSSAPSSSISIVSKSSLSSLCHHSSFVVGRLVSFAATDSVEQHLSVGKHARSLCTPFLPSFWGVSFGHRQLPTDLQVRFLPSACMRFQGMTSTDGNHQPARSSFGTRRFSSLIRYALRYKGWSNVNAAQHMLSLPALCRTNTIVLYTASLLDGLSGIIG